MKFGVIDQDYMNQLATSSNQFDELKGSLKKLLSVDVRRGSKSFLAQITECSVIAESGETPIAWCYKWKRVDFGDLYFNNLSSNVSTDELYLNPESGNNDQTTDAVQEVIGGHFSFAQAYAYNLAEISNIQTAPIVFGINMSGSSYPENFSPQPVPDNSYVFLTEINTVALGNVSYIFDRQGTHDGECDE